MLQDTNGNPVLAPIEIDGIQYPPNIEQLWTAEQLSEIGLTVVPDPVQPPSIISDRQFFQQLALTPDPSNAGSTMISQSDALAAVCTGTIPPVMQPLIESLPTDEQFAAKMKLAGATQFDINDPVTQAIGMAYKWTPAQLLAFWAAASQL